MPATREEQDALNAARAAAHFEKPFAPTATTIDDTRPEREALRYIAGQSFHIRRALERIADALETPNYDPIEPSDLSRVPPRDDR